MSEELLKKLDTAVARIAALEAERGRAEKPAPSNWIDPKRFAADPAGEMKRAGISQDHVTKILVAHALGDQAPADLRVYASMGEQVSATHELASEVESMRRRFAEMDSQSKREALRKSFSALVGDKAKYPTLAAAYATDPSLFESTLSSHEGNAEALAAAEETRLKTLATAVGYIPPASQDAVTKTDPSTQVQAQSNSIDNTPPPLPKPTQGVFTPEANEQLKAAVMRKYNLQG